MGGANAFFAVSVFACMGIRVDPDTLPSIEVLLVPPKYPFPQIREYLNEIHDKREVVEKLNEGTLLNSYKSQLIRMKQTITQMIKPVLMPLEKQWREGMYYPVLSSLLQSKSIQNPSNIENLVVHVKPVPMPGNIVKRGISLVNQIRGGTEFKQISQGISEFYQFSQIITKCLQTSLKKYFGSNRRNIHPIVSYLQQVVRDDQNGLNPVVNIRVGSSDIGDGLLDGDSYPSVLGMVSEENEMRTNSQTILLNEVLFFSNELIMEASNMIKALLFPPMTRMPLPGMGTQTDPLDSSFLQIPGVTDAMSKAGNVLPFPPALSRILRKRAMKNSTVQLDITPPQMDDRSIITALNALVHSEKAFDKVRVEAYVLVKRELAKAISRQIDQLVKTAAIAWGILPDPQNFDSIMIDG